MVKLKMGGDSPTQLVKKLKTIENRTIRTGKKSPKDASKYMVMQARLMAPIKTGRLKKNINAFRRGKNSYEVVSHRFPTAKESPNFRKFPIHAWADGRRDKGGWKKGLYSATNNTGTPGYFTKAAGKTRYRFFKMVVRDIRKGLAIKI